MREETLTEWEICQLLANDAVEEIEQGRDPRDDSHEPWGGIFKAKYKPSITYDVSQLTEEN